MLGIIRIVKSDNWSLGKNYFRHFKIMKIEKKSDWNWNFFLTCNFDYRISQESGPEVNFLSQPLPLLRSGYHSAYFWIFLSLLDFWILFIFWNFFSKFCDLLTFFWYFKFFKFIETYLILLKFSSLPSFSFIFQHIFEFKKLF